MDLFICIIIPVEQEEEQDILLSADKIVNIFGDEHKEIKSKAELLTS